MGECRLFTPAPDQWRVTALGDGAVGKTSIAVQFTLHSFTGLRSHYRRRVSEADDGRWQASPLDPGTGRLIQLATNSVCHIEIVDTAGQEEYSTLREQWVREGQGFILVYSITDRRSFERMENFRQALLRAKSRSPPLFVLVGNKCDQTYERQVMKHEGESLAQEWGCDFFETSARTGHNIDKLFQNVVRSLRAVRDGAELPQNGGAPIRAHTGPLRPTPKRKKSRCIIV
ncbi:Ras GTPase ras2 [Ceratobasidium sp. 414]|nr:Ras GTPase ras2 [Ceratobasidium sp. 414]